MPLSPLSPKPSRVLFIDENYIKTTTPIGGNIDPQIIMSAILVSQDKHMLQILGSGIYAELKDQITNGTLTTLNRSLLEDYCQPIVAWFALVECLPNISFRLQDKGIEKKDSENSEAAGIDDIIFLMKNYENTAKFYAQQLISYLRRNNELYPLYYNPGGTYGTGIDTYYGVGTEYNSGMVIPNNDFKYCGNKSIIGLGIGIPINFL